MDSDNLFLPAKSVSAFQLLGSHEDSVVISFCTTAISFIRNGVKAKSISSAASKIGVPDEVVSDALNAIITVLTYAARAQMSTDEFLKCVNSLNLTENVITCLCSTYEEHSTELTDLCLTALRSHLPQFKDLEWRMDLDVSTRSAHNIHIPRVVLNISTDSHEDVLFETDPSTLIHITDQLEKAIVQLRSHQYKRIAKFAK